MYKFHDDFMNYNADIFNLILTDTDSFIYESRENFYETKYQHKEIFYLSNQFKDGNYYYT